MERDALLAPMVGSLCGAPEVEADSRWIEARTLRTAAYRTQQARRNSG